MSQQSVYSLVLVIPGEPVAQPRTKATVIAGRAHVYTPKGGIADWKAMVRKMAFDAHCGEPLAGPVRVDCEFVFSRPKGHFGTGKNAGQLKSSAPYWHTAKPDRDNLDKACLDALKDVLLADDKSVCCGTLIKRYAHRGELPHARISVSVAEDLA